MENEFGLSEADRLYLKSLCSYYNGDLEHTLTLLGQSVALDQDHDRSLKMREQVRLLNRSLMLDNESNFRQTFREVVEVWTNALQAFSSGISCKLCEILLHNRAIAHSKIGNFLKGISDCSEVLKTDKDNVKVLLLRAECYEHVEEFRESIKDYEVVLTTNSIKTTVVKSVRIVSKIEDLKTKIKHIEAEQYQTQGDFQFDKKSYHEALHYYDQAIDRCQENISFHIKRIVCYMKMTDYIQAFQKCQSAQSINNNVSEINDYMTECSLVLGYIYFSTRSIQRCRETGTEKTKLNNYEKELHEIKHSTERAKENMSRSNFQEARKFNELF